MFEEFVQRIINKPDALILTPNKRLARYIQRDLESVYQQQQKTSWITPNCMPLQSWCQQLYQQLQLLQCLPPKINLTDWQREKIWHDVIAADPDLTTLIESKQLTRIAIKTWDVCQQWQITQDTLAEYDLSYDQQAFCRWCATVAKIYHDNNFIDNSQLITALRQCFAHADQTLLSKVLPEQVCLFAFDAMTPVQETWLAELAEHFQLQICHHAYHVETNETLHYRAPDCASEIETMIAWARQISASNPTATIACIVPDLPQHQSALKQTIIRQFAPELANIALADQLLPVNISGGEALASAAMIQAALDWCRLCFLQLPIETVSTLLTSPYADCAEQHKFMRAQTDCELRASYVENCRLTQLIAWLQGKSQRNPADELLLVNLNQIAERQQTFKTKASHQQWCQIFQDCLHLIGWPGDIEINSIQYQRLQHWHLALQQFMQLDVIDDAIDAPSAIEQLAEICQQSLFQPQTEDTAVQVLGLLEASGISFDYVWIMGLDNQTLPSPADPNPLLPYALQRNRHCPHATPQREADIARKILNRYQTSTKRQLIFSYAEEVESEARQASSLIQAHPRLTLETPTNTDDPTAIMEILDECVGTAINADQPLHGGSQMLKDYSACYFRGYALYRLNGKPLQPFSQLFSPLNRGLYCHSAMEWFWQQVGDWQNCQSLSAQQKQDLLSQAIAFAFKQQLSPVTLESMKHLLVIEEQCILAILSSWLFCEEQRKPFTVIHTEQAQQIQLHHCRISVRIDRIDKTQDDEVLIIDYKTGSPNVDGWLDQRLDDPQLPLYALTSPYPVSGIVFAKLRAEEQTFIGITESDQQMENVNLIEDFADYRDWPQLKEHWRQRLDHLVDDIESGQARLNPKYGAQTCAFCPCQTLCRYHEKESLDESIS